MNPSKALVILLFVAALVTGIWLVLEESPPSLKVLGTDGTENTQAADLSSATPDQPAAIAPPTRDAVERSVKVVDTNGDVVVGVRVSYQLTSGQREYKNFARMEEQLEEMQAMDFATSFLGSPYLVSDSDGLAHLAEDGFGLVFADTGKMSGLALVDKPGVGKPKQYVLQLSPYPSLPIQVINADGTPAPGMTVDLLYTKKDDEPNNSQRWQWRNGLAHSLPTDATGFTSIRMDPASSLKVRNQNIDQVNLQIAILEGLVTPLIQDVQIDQTELLILRLPRCGSVEVRLSGYPANFFPKLVLMEDNEPGLFPGLIALSPQEIKGKNGVWSFPRVALNKEYSVQIFRFAIQRKGSQSQTSQSRTELPTKQFSGPIRAGESVSVEMEYLKGAWLTGRILQADGKPIKTGRYMGKFYFQAGKGGQITPNMKLEADVAAEGTFVIPAPDEDQLLGLNPDYS